MKMQPVLYDHSQNVSLESVGNKQLSNDEERQAEKMMTPSFKQDLFTSNDKVKHRAMELSKEGRHELDKSRKRRKSAKLNKRKEKEQPLKNGHGFYSSESENSLPPIKQRERRSNISCKPQRTDRGERMKGSSDMQLEYNNLCEWATLSQKSMQGDCICSCQCGNGKSKEGKDTRELSTKAKSRKSHKMAMKHSKDEKHIKRL